jgi:O-succinylbenzoic acid--CoA ligase
MLPIDDNNLQKIINPDWLLIPGLTVNLYEIFQEKLNYLTQRFHHLNRPVRILISQPSPIEFLGSLLGAIAHGQSHIFLGNHHWQKSEWQQVLEIVKPDLIWGDLGFDYAINYDLDDNQVNPELPALLIMIATGGTSGKIKFVMHTWQTLTASVQGFQKYFGINQINSCCVLPLYHVSGFMQFMRAFLTDGQLLILPSYKELFNQTKYPIQPTNFFISLVPTQLQRLLDHADDHLIKYLAEFSTVLLGGAPAHPQLLKTARKYHIKLAPTYGMTETASQIVTLKPADFLQGITNSGRILPHAELNIYDQENNILSTNQTGIIKIKSTSLGLGYYPQFFTEQEFTTDDLGYLDNHNYLHIIGRDQEKIISGGENIFPAEVEAVIYQTNLVTDICVIGLPDPDWGEIAIALYSTDQPTVNATVLHNSLQGKLSKYKQPKYWLKLEKIPRNDQGKINRLLLKEIAQTLLNQTV